MNLLTILIGGYFILSLVDKWGTESYEDEEFNDFEEYD